MSTDIANPPHNVYDDHEPRTRQPGVGSASSIWAPQPQPSETTWPKALDAFSRVAEREMQHPARPELQHHASSMPGPVVTREDVFGPPPGSKESSGVGAIGDGRKKVTPDFDKTHVEQLLRTLDLNSPDPYHAKQQQPLNLMFENSPGSPDFSPISMSSALLTPTDLSPARSFDINGKPQLTSPYEMIAAGARGSAYMQHSSLLLEPGSPTRVSPTHPSTSLQQANAPATNAIPASSTFSPMSSASSFPIFKPFHEPASPVASSAQSYTLHHTSPSASLSQEHAHYNSTQSDQYAHPRRAEGDIALQGLRSQMFNSTFGGDWQVPPQVVPMHSLASLQSAQSLQLHQQYQQLVSNSDWLRTEEAMRHSLAQAALLPSHPVSGAVAPSQNANSLGLGLGLASGFTGCGITTGGLEDSIHAPPSSRRIPSSSAPNAFTGNLNESHQPLQVPTHQQQRHSSSMGSFNNHSQGSPTQGSHEPINFLSLLHPSSSPPYHSFVSRIIKSSDQQASIFLQQKLKVADIPERAKIVDAICARGFEMMAHRFGNWAVQRCLEAASTPEERKKIVSCMKGRVVDLATNCYGCHVLQKALDCEEDIRLLIVSELLLGDPAQTLVNKHASHVWSKIMELSWTPPAPPIFAYVNKSLKGKWAALACHETGSLVVQHAFENLEDSAKDGIVDELLNQGSVVFSEVAKNQWGSYCVQHILEHGSDKHRLLTLDHLVSGLLEYATNEQGYKSITKALKEGGKETLDRVIKRMCEPAKSGRRAMVVDLALSVTGSQLIASVLPTADREQRALLYDCIRGHIVTLRGCKTGSKVIWLFDRMRAYYGY